MTSEYSILTFRTSDLDEGMLLAYCRLFEETFGKARTPSRIHEQFGASALGHGFHALLMHPAAGLCGAY